MKILALDISTKTGWALFSEEEKGPTLSKHGHIISPALNTFESKYPFNYLDLAAQVAGAIFNVIDDEQPDRIVIEETNKGKQRYSQKMLEFIHCTLIGYLKEHKPTTPVLYVNTSDWRKALGVYLTKEQKKNNAKLSKAKRQGISKKEIGIKGKITRKHVAVEMVNQQFGLSLKQKENDTAEAILLGLAFCRGVPICDGKDNVKRKRN
jgi:Holliday junction resolvasome RuvABC endonuclease subunit